VRAVAIAVALAGVLSACNGSGADDAGSTAPTASSAEPSETTGPPSPTEPSATTSSDPPEVGPVAAGPVQDLWILHGLRTVRPDGTTVDLLPDLAALATAAGEGPVQVADEAEFVPAPALGTHLAGSTGERRDGVDMVGGLLTTPTAAMVTFLATPTPGARWPDTDDSIVFALPAIGALEPGQPLIAEYQFVQLLPDDAVDEFDVDGALADPLATAAARLRAGSYHYPALAPGPDAPSAIFVKQLGVVREGPADGPEGLRRVAQSSSQPFGEVPAKARPFFDGFADGLTECLTDPGSNLDCIENVFDGQEEGLEDTLGDLWEPNEDPAPTPSGGIPDGEDCALPIPGVGCSSTGIPIPASVCSALDGCGLAVADPHLRTFDGLRYDLQLVGEFVLARSVAAAGGAGPEIEVQIRTAPVGTTRSASVVSRALIAVDGHVVEIPTDNTTPILIDGEEVPKRPPRGQGYVLDELVVEWWMSTVDVHHAGRPVVRVNRSRAHLDVYVDPTAAATWTGLLGDADGETEGDLVARGGTVVTTELPDRYDVFADSWRLTDDESWFSYASGESTATFTDRSFPDGPADLADLPADTRAFAATVCRLAGVTQPGVHEDCVLDLALTGDLGLVHSAQAAQASLLTAQVADPTSIAAYVGTEATMLPDETSNELRGASLAVGEGLALVRTTRARDQVLHAIELDTGLVRWSVDGIMGTARPVVVDGLGVAVRLREDQAGDATMPVTLLSFDDGSVLAQEPGLVGGAGYTIELSAVGTTVLSPDRHAVEAFDAADGLAPRWTYETPSDEVIHPLTPAVAGHVIVLSHLLPDQLQLRSLDPLTGAEVAAIEVTGEVPRSLSVLADGRLAVFGEVGGGSPRILTVVEVGADGSLRAAWQSTFDEDDGLGRPDRALAVGDVVVAFSNASNAPPLVGYTATGELAWAYDQEERYLGGTAAAAVSSELLATAPVRDGWLTFVDAAGEVVRVIERPPLASFLPPDQLTPLPDGRLVASGSLVRGGIYLRILDP
jgi:hypothetical protein